LVRKADDVFIAHHADVAARFEADFGLCIRRELLTGFEDDGAVEVVRLLSRRNVQFSIRIQIGLKCLRLHLGGDGANLRRA
jgi:hypothetical protein